VKSRVSASVSGGMSPREASTGSRAAWSETSPSPTSKHELPVKYTGVLPTCSVKGQGVVAHGRIGADGVFMADEVLAKHDEISTCPPSGGVR